VLASLIRENISKKLETLVFGEQLKIVERKINEIK
jgi:hypothetical protein